LDFPAVLINSFTGTQFFHFSVFNAGIAEKDSFNNMRAWPVRMRNTSTLPYINGFNSGQITENGIQVGNTDSLTTWTIVSTMGPVGFGPAASVQSRNYSFRGEMDRLYLPVFNLGNNSNWILKVKVAYRAHTNGRKDSLFVRLSNNCNGQPTTIANYSDSTLASGSTINSTFTPFSPTEWKEITINLAPYLSNNTQLNLYFEWRNDNGNHFYMDDIQILSANSIPIASYSSQQSPTCLPITLTLTNSSSLADSVRFELSNGQVVAGNTATVTYTTGGSYTNRLIAYNSNGNDTLTQVVNIPFDPAPDFAVSDTIYTIGVSQPLTFTNLSQNASSFNWIFGDGTTTNQINPTPKTYNATGIYTVMLQAANPNCMITATKTNLIRVDIATNASNLSRQGWHLYPNPTKSTVNLRLPEGVSVSALAIINTLGQRQTNLKYDGESQQINISLPPLPSGYYQLEARGTKGELVHLPLVIE
jgi:PKD repeat protein